MEALKRTARVIRMSSHNTPIAFPSDREALIKEIVQEMRKDAVKEEAPTKLKKANWLGLVSNFFKHPATLLLIGFAFTAGVGGWLTNRWQRQEWDRQQLIERNEWERQQLRQIDIHVINIKYQLIDEITKAIGERNAAARGILSPLQQNLPYTDLLKEEEERINTWQRVTGEWRVNSQILKLKISTYITNKDVATRFEQIIVEQKSIAVAINEVKNDLRKYSNADDKEATQELDILLKRLNTTGDTLKLLVEDIAEEARKEVKGTA